jgi:hypothetical protein
VQEEWRPALDWPEYHVSDQGRVKTLKRLMMRKNGRPLWVKERILKPRPHVESGYLNYWLSVNGKKRSVGAHALVLEAFVGPCPEGMEARHLDGNKLNNSRENLCWGTHGENMEDQKRHGTHAPMVGTSNPNARLTEDDVRRIRSIADTRSRADIAREYGVTPALISQIVRGIRWKHVV